VTAHKFLNGDAVRYANNGEPGIGIAEGTYFVRVVDDRIKLFANKPDALVNDSTSTRATWRRTGSTWPALATATA
jgi:hypothetical protein